MTGGDGLTLSLAALTLVAVCVLWLRAGKKIRNDEIKHRKLLDAAMREYDQRRR